MLICLGSFFTVLSYENLENAIKFLIDERFKNGHPIDNSSEPLSNIYKNTITQYENELNGIIRKNSSQYGSILNGLKSGVQSHDSSILSNTILKSKKSQISNQEIVLRSNNNNDKNKFPSEITLNDKKPSKIAKKESFKEINPHSESIKKSTSKFNEIIKNDNPFKENDDKPDLTCKLKTYSVNSSKNSNLNHHTASAKDMSVSDSDSFKINESIPENGSVKSSKTPQNEGH